MDAIEGPKACKDNGDVENFNITKENSVYSAALYEIHEINLNPSIAYCDNTLDSSQKQPDDPKAEIKFESLTSGSCDIASHAISSSVTSTLDSLTSPVTSQSRVSATRTCNLPPSTTSKTNSFSTETTYKGDPASNNPLSSIVSSDNEIKTKISENSNTAVIEVNVLPVALDSDIVGETKFNDYNSEIILIKSLSTESATFSPSYEIAYFSETQLDNQNTTSKWVTEEHDLDKCKRGTNSTHASSQTQFSTKSSTSGISCPNIEISTSFSNAQLDDQNTNSECLIAKLDLDKCKHGITSTTSSMELTCLRKKCNGNEDSFSIDDPPHGGDEINCQRTSPLISKKACSSSSVDSVNSGGNFTTDIGENMMQAVKSYFLTNKVTASQDLSHSENLKLINEASYFSEDFVSNLQISSSSTNKDDGLPYKGSNLPNDDRNFPQDNSRLVMNERTLPEDDTRLMIDERNFPEDDTRLVIDESTFPEEDSRLVIDERTFPEDDSRLVIDERTLPEYDRLAIDIYNLPIEEDYLDEESCFSNEEDSLSDKEESLSDEGTLDFTLSRVAATCKMFVEWDITEEDFISHCNVDIQRQGKWSNDDLEKMYRDGDLKPWILKRLDLIQEQVGYHIFNEILIRVVKRKKKFEDIRVNPRGESKSDLGVENLLEKYSRHCIKMQDIEIGRQGKERTIYETSEMSLPTNMDDASVSYSPSSSPSSSSSSSSYSSPDEDEANHFKSGIHVSFAKFTTNSIKLNYDSDSSIDEDERNPKKLKTSKSTEEWIKVQSKRSSDVLGEESMIHHSSPDHFRKPNWYVDTDSKETFKQFFYQKDKENSIKYPIKPYFSNGCVSKTSTKLNEKSISMEHYFTKTNKNSKSAMIAPEFIHNFVSKFRNNFSKEMPSQKKIRLSETLNIGQLKSNDVENTKKILHNF